MSPERPLSFESKEHPFLSTKEDIPMQLNLILANLLHPKPQCLPESTSEEDSFENANILFFEGKLPPTRHQMVTHSRLLRLCSERRRSIVEIWRVSIRHRWSCRIALGKGKNEPNTDIWSMEYCDSKIWLRRVLKPNHQSCKPSLEFQYGFSIWVVGGCSDGSTR